ncbi:hypothetical protein TDSAC_1721 [Thermodesulfobium acidiphilum]|uniref:DUF155 domain-containing protein n=1 Tax=Thermodesulfobium acidiphilum TaxID=1794699 RepID=A0A2R4W2M7_THEAF|nr:hypothetical protein [Thermodesulfobium acidiphilum]AWB11057.1 hypothetical protein TDSAC_1721 [Thermodesulfobium acidiphilum]PMP85039.1 MAG: hypothetical protein C0174_05600 [Thermodesulfobium narugense]
MEFRGKIFSIYSFYIAEEINLALAQNLLNASKRVNFRRSKSTPKRLQYETPPITVNLDIPFDFDIIDDFYPSNINLKIFDFGAVSISLLWNGKTEFVNLKHISSDLFDSNLEEKVLSYVSELKNYLAKTLKKPFDELIYEDYIVFQTDEINSKPYEFLKKNRETLAHILRMEKENLSQMEIDEATQIVLSYYEFDMVIIDYNASFVIDADYEDILEIIEFSQVELAQIRALDRILDKSLDYFESIIEKKSIFLPPIKEISLFFLNVSLNRERLDNALKLIGDLYLARIYKSLGLKLHVSEWENSLERNLKTLSDIYQLLREDFFQKIANFLEITIVVLIFVEIILGLLRIL